MSPLVRMPPSAITGTPLCAASRRVHDRGQLRHADAGDDPRGADRARPDADLDRVGARVDQRPGRLGGGDIAGDDLDRVREPLHPLDRAATFAIVAVRGVDDDAVAVGVDQRLGRARSPCRRPWSRRRRAAGPSPSLVAIGVATAFSMSLTVIRPTQRSSSSTTSSFSIRRWWRSRRASSWLDAERDGGEILVRHQLADRLARVLGEAHVAVGEDADQLAGLLDDRDAADLVAPSSAPAPRRASGPGVMVIGLTTIPLSKRLTCADRRRLLLERQVAVEHADPAELRHARSPCRLRSPCPSPRTGSGC